MKTSLQRPSLFGWSPAIFLCLSAVSFAEMKLVYKEQTAQSAEIYVFSGEDPKGIVVAKTSQDGRCADFQKEDKTLRVCSQGEAFRVTEGDQEGIWTELDQPQGSLIEWKSGDDVYRITKKVAESGISFYVQDKLIAQAKHAHPENELTVFDESPELGLRNSSFPDAFWLSLWSPLLLSESSLIETPQNGLGLVALEDSTRKKHHLKEGMIAGVATGGALGLLAAGAFLYKKLRGSPSKKPVLPEVVPAPEAKPDSEEGAHSSSVQQAPTIPQINLVGADGQILGKDSSLSFSPGRVSTAKTFKRRRPRSKKDKTAQGHKALPPVQAPEAVVKSHEGPKVNVSGQSSPEVLGPSSEAASRSSEKQNSFEHPQDHKQDGVSQSQQEDAKVSQDQKGAVSSSGSSPSRSLSLFSSVDDLSSLEEQALRGSPNGVSQLNLPDRGHSPKNRPQSQEGDVREPEEQKEKRVAEAPLANVASSGSPESSYLHQAFKKVAGLFTSSTLERDKKVPEEEKSNTLPSAPTEEILSTSVSGVGVGSSENGNLERDSQPRTEDVNSSADFIASPQSLQEEPKSSENKKLEGPVESQKPDPSSQPFQPSQSNADSLAEIPVVSSSSVSRKDEEDVKFLPNEQARVPFLEQMEDVRSGREPDAAPQELVRDGQSSLDGARGGQCRFLLKLKKTVSAQNNLLLGKQSKERPARWTKARSTHIGTQVSYGEGDELQQVIIHFLISIGMGSEALHTVTELGGSGPSHPSVGDSSLLSLDQVLGQAVLEATSCNGALNLKVSVAGEVTFALDVKHDFEEEDALDSVSIALQLLQESKRLQGN